MLLSWNIVCVFVCLFLHLILLLFLSRFLCFCCMHLHFCLFLYVLPVMAVGQCRGTCGSQALASLKQPLHRYGNTAMDLLGGSGGVVNSFDFCPVSLKSLGCFYFGCVLSSQWKAVTVNLRILHCQLSRHFWRSVVRMCLATSNNMLLVLKDVLKRFFFFSTRTRDLLVRAAKNDANTLFFPPSTPFPR